jgi:hypothetical protein
MNQHSSIETPQQRELRYRRLLRKAIWVLVGLLPTLVLSVGTLVAVQHGIIEKSSIKTALAVIAVVAVLSLAFVAAKFKGVVTIIMVGLILSLPPNQSVAAVQSGDGVQTKALTLVLRLDENGKPDLSSLPPEIPESVRQAILQQAASSNGEPVVVAPNDGKDYSSLINDAKAKAAVMASDIKAGTLKGGQPGVPTPQLALWAFIIVIIIIIIVVAVIIYVIITIVRMIPPPGNGGGGGGEGPGFVGPNSPSGGSLSGKTSLTGDGPFAQWSIPRDKLTTNELTLPQLILDQPGATPAPRLQLQVSTNLTDWAESCTLSLTNLFNMGGSNYVAEVVVQTNGVEAARIAVSSPIQSPTNCTFTVPDPVRIGDPGNTRLPKQFFRIVPMN